jgi:hypothetical protein
MWFVAACAVGFVLSWPLANMFRSIIERIAGIQFTAVIIALIMISLILDAMQGQKIMLYFLTLLISLAAGWALRKHDVMPLVFTFVLGSSLQSVIYSIIQLYF